jgi:hypothetical protein
MEAAEDGSGPDASFPSLQLVKDQARPRVAFASSKADSRLVAALAAPLPGCSESLDVRLEKSSLYSLASARRALESCHVDGMAGGLHPRERLHVINTMVGLAREQQVCAVGALLVVMARDGLLGYCQGAARRPFSLCPCFSSLLIAISVSCPRAGWPGWQCPV